MAKKRVKVGAKHRSHSYKTKKRLEIKRKMLEQRSVKHRRKK